MRIWCIMWFITACSQANGKQNLGSRLTALGKTGAVVSDIWSVQANPAGISKVDRLYISLNYLKNPLSPELSEQGLALVWPVSNHFIGLNFYKYGFPEYLDIKFGLSYCRQFGSKLSLATRFNINRLSIIGYGSALNYTVDVGLLYRFNPQWTLGLNIDNPANQHSRVLIQSYLPFTCQLGIQYLPSDKILIAATLNNTYKEKAVLNFGLEYDLLTVLSLRAGFSSYAMNEYYGIGLKIKKLTFDIANSYNIYLKYTPQITLSYGF